MSEAVVTAPGKLMICGEYAVLDGAEAIVTAVDRRARVRLDETTQAVLPPPEALAARTLAESALGSVPLAMSVDVTALRQADKKLGLGSSAAAAAASAAAVFTYHGEDLRDATTREHVLEVAVAGHRSIAPQGSGADVTASVLGGFQCVHLNGDRLSSRTIAWPSDVYIKPVWTGTSARTSDFLEAVAALRSGDARRYDALIGRLAECASDFVAAVDGSDPDGIVAATDAYGDAMGALGAGAGVRIICNTTRKIRGLANSSGGAAKPSGAGGGDIVIGIFADPDAAARFESACQDDGLELLSLEVGAEGIRAEADPGA